MNKSSLIVILLLVLLISACVSSTPTTLPEAKPTTSIGLEIETNLPEHVEMSNGVPGITRDDMTELAEGLDLHCQDTAATSYGFHLICNFDEWPFIIGINIEGKDEDNILQVGVGTVLPENPNKDQIARATELLVTVAGLRYQGAEPENAQIWVENLLPTLDTINSGKPETTIFGGVKYVMHGVFPTYMTLVIGDSVPDY